MGGQVVVGYDGSPESVGAVRWAAGSAARLGRPLEVVHVWGLARQLDLPPLTGASQYVRASAQEVADEGAEIARTAAPQVEVTAVLDDGSPAQALVARSADAVLVVVGRHGSRLTGALLGSVSLAVLQHAQCPVIVVPRPDPATEHEPWGSVVVGVDGSPASLGAVDAAGRYAQGAGAELTVVTTWESPVQSRSLTYWLREYPDSSPGELAQKVAERAQLPAVERLAARFPGVVVAAAVAEGSAPHVLGRYAEHADLLVVGTRGRGGLAGLVLGSVSQWLVAHAACPVLVSRAVPTD